MPEVNKHKLSVVIVNYNVRFFLEQCLHSVSKALEDVNSEVFVVDNNSVDGSVAMVREKFPEVSVIANKENLGFSKANNQAMKLAEGEYILILNPDTVVEEDTFHKVLRFMDEHPDAGALGVKMIDGNGQFLPESKRALPTPLVSFYKVFGLSWLFPKSKRFGQYHLGYLDKDLIHKVDVLPGAFMLLRKESLDKSGLFDESFFMYGEDIDLSYRIIRAGYNNYYFPDTAIIHYKGESTRKSSMNYVLVFYEAMIIFARKHFSPKNARLFSASIHAAIYFRMILSLFKRFFDRALYFLLDAVLAFSGFLVINPIWESVKFKDGGGHPPEFLQIFVPSYILIWILSIFFSGGYDKPYSLKKLIQGLVIGTGLILILYSLLPESYRFSRALILLGTAWNLIILSLTRKLFDKLGWKSFALKSNHVKRVIIASKEKEFERIRGLLNQTAQQVEIIGRVDTSAEVNPEQKLNLGSINRLSEIIDINRIDEIIFSAADLTSQEIIRNMLALQTMRTDYKIAPPESPSIIGSNSINTAGDLYVIDIRSIAEPANRRNKRLLDIAVSFILVLTLPLNIWFFIPKLKPYLLNILSVLAGNKTWIGYYPAGESADHSLPDIKPGVLNPDPKLLNPSIKLQIDCNLNYARYYDVATDFRILLNHFRMLNN
ncbi:MAG: glycosyltransferase [Bacteroidales bacterium]|nr:glycosyltransferase [Bacteroidales bacterium]